VADGTEPDWILVCDPAFAPRPGAVEALSGALERIDGLPAPALLAAVVVGGDGEVDAALAAWYRRAPTELAMAAAERRLLPIRAAAGPVLVRRTVAAAQPPPAGLAPGAVLEWTARLLREAPGYLVPESRFGVSGRARDPALAPVTAAKLVAGRAFAGTDRLRVAAELLERARRRARGPAS
jgi:hypothetical protein